MTEEHMHSTYSHGSDLENVSLSNRFLEKEQREKKQLLLSDKEPLVHADILLSWRSEAVSNYV